LTEANSKALLQPAEGAPATRTGGRLYQQAIDGYWDADTHAAMLAREKRERKRV
jgi:hypothetical protein